MIVYGKYECFVMQMLYVCVLCAYCGSSQCCVLHDLQFVNAGRGCKDPSPHHFPHHISIPSQPTTSNDSETKMQQVEEHLNLPLCNIWYIV